MRILRRLMDELFTDVEIVIVQAPDKPYRTLTERSSGFIDIPSSPGRLWKTVFLMGGLRRPRSYVVLQDGAGCSITVRRQFMGWIVVELNDGLADAPEPTIHTALLNRGERVEVADSRGRKIRITLLRHRDSKTALRKFGIDI